LNRQIKLKPKLRNLKSIPQLVEAGSLKKDYARSESRGTKPVILVSIPQFSDLMFAIVIPIVTILVFYPFDMSDVLNIAAYLALVFVGARHF
jgi:hypothetical protein